MNNYGWIDVVLVVSWRIPHETHVSPSFPNSNPSLCLTIKGYELNVMLCKFMFVWWIYPRLCIFFMKLGLSLWMKPWRLWREYVNCLYWCWLCYYFMNYLVLCIGYDLIGNWSMDVPRTERRYEGWFFFELKYERWIT